MKRSTVKSAELTGNPFIRKADITSSSDYFHKERIDMMTYSNEEPLEPTEVSEIDLNQVAMQISWPKKRNSKKPTQKWNRRKPKAF